MENRLNKTFIGGHRHNGQTNAKGCHFTVGVYFIEEKTLYYGDSLGWSMPQEVNTIVTNLLKYTKLLDRDSQINLTTVHRSDIDKAGMHRYLRSCWRHFALQTDGRICGVSSIIILCIAAKDEFITGWPRSDRWF